MDPLCICGAVIEGDTEAECRFWLELHIEAAERRGDDLEHWETPF